LIEKRESLDVRLSVLNDVTGETFDVTGSHNISSKYYSIKKLNKRICVMDLFTIQSKICKSSKDILIFRDILLSTDKHNEIRFNITEFSKSNGYKREYVTRLLKKFVGNDLARRIDRGVYLINPLVFQSIGSTNELIEKAQSIWCSYTTKEPDIYGTSS